MTRVVLGCLVWIAADALLTVAVGAYWRSGEENAGILVLTQAASPLDDNIGMSMTALLGSLGAAVAVAAVTSYFLCFLKKQRREHKQFLERFLSSQSESQQKFQDQLERRISRNDLVQENFQERLNQLIVEQNAILLETSGAMKSIEKDMSTSSAAFQAVLKTVDSLQLVVSTLELLTCRRTGGRPDRPIEKRQP